MGEFRATIGCFSGAHFHLDDPEFNIIDIAHGTSNICRFNGQCDPFYSVAEHSVLVSWIMQDLELGDPMVGLMHDGHEAYLSDVPSPIKRLLPDWAKLDAQIEEALYKQFNLPFPREPGCKEADLIAFFIERDALFAEGLNESFNTVKFPELKEKAEQLMLDGWQINCWEPLEARRQFIERYEHLQEQTREG